MAKHINERINGPENAHLTCGPGIYLNTFKQVNKPIQRYDRSLMSTEILCHFANLLQIVYGRPMECHHKLIQVLKTISKIEKISSTKILSIWEKSKL